jgi:UDPglucose 6-dehydrogenase
MKITIFGAGYVGLVTGACLAELGNSVLCCDTDKSKIESLKKYEVPFYEPGLPELVKRNIKVKRLMFSDDPKKSVKFGELVFIAVGTPPSPNGEADLSYVKSVAKTVGEELKSDNVVIVTKSTVPVGTSGQVKNIIQTALDKRESDIKFAVVNNPEFLREGKAVEDFMVPDRVVVGVENEWAKQIISNLYAPLTKNSHPVYFMDILSSEMTKYASNTFIAARISLINEIAQICELVGADVENVRIAVGADKRIGHQYLYPGVGYGGSCFPKDIQALAFQAKQKGLPTPMIESIEEVNATQKKMFTKKITGLKGGIKGKTVAIWGLAFKPKTDDMRFAPSLDIINALLKQGAKVKAYDPAAQKEAAKIFGKKISFSEDMYEILKKADCLAVITEWPQFKEPDFKRIKELMNKPVIIDGRNIYSPQRMKEFGFTYHCIGRNII